MAYGIVYKITNKLNGKGYVGKTTRPLEVRFNEHAKADSYIGNSIRKYGEENFSREVIEECGTSEQLNEREIFWIAHFNCKQPNGYNQTDGGDKPTFLDHHHEEETKLSLSLSHRGESPYKNLLDEIDKRQLTYSAFAKRMDLSQPAVSLKLRGERQFTDNDVAKLVEIFNLPVEYLLAREDGQPTTITSRKGEKNPFFGKHRTDETRMKSATNNRGDTPYKNLLAEMDKRQISYRGLAALLEISQANISRKMTGVRNFTAKDISKLVEIFGKPVEYLMARDD